MMLSEYLYNVKNRGKPGLKYVTINCSSMGKRAWLNSAAAVFDPSFFCSCVHIRICASLKKHIDDDDDDDDRRTAAVTVGHTAELKKGKTSGGEVMEEEKKIK